MRSAARIKPAQASLESKLDRLATETIVELRKQYEEMFRAPPPKAFGPDLLRRCIAQRVQEKAYGGLSRPAQTLLNQMIKAVTAKPNGRLELPRRMKPGSELVREWKGRPHRVLVVSEGFVYDGKAYPSLSEIASHITGTRWNGPRFFGLRAKQKEALANGK